jgi:predicted TIM-barrel fold metal-dependent hydrolase
MTRIDFENHFAATGWLAAVRRNDIQAPDWAISMFNSSSPIVGALTNLGEGRIKAMDEAGIDVAVLSLSAPGIEQFEPRAATVLAKEANDELAAAVSKYPDRFRGFAALSARDTDAAVVEFERCVRELGFVGWNTHSNFGDSYLDEKRYWPLLAKAEEMQAPIYIHPDLPIIPQFCTYGFGLAGPSYGYGAETALAMMRLVIGGVFDVFPKLKIIIGHYGEGLPFMMDRVNRPYVQGLVRTDPAIAPPLKRTPADYLMDNMVVTTSGNYSTDAFVCTKNALGIERIVLGSDYPYESMSTCVDFLEAQSMSPSEAQDLYETNASSLGVLA